MKYLLLLPLLLLSLLTYGQESVKLYYQYDHTTRQILPDCNSKAMLPGQILFETSRGAQELYFIIAFDSGSTTTTAALPVISEFVKCIGNGMGGSPPYDDPLPPDELAELALDCMVEISN